MDNYTHFTKAYEALRDAGVIHNQTEFAALLGANKSTVSCALNGKEQYLTDRLVARADKVVKEYLSEDGRALPAPADSILVIPTGARAGTIADFCEAVHEYDCERIVSPVKGADFAMQVAGDSMSPEYPSGSQIIVKRINEEAFVEWGEGLRTGYRERPNRQGGPPDKRAGCHRMRQPQSGIPAVHGQDIIHPGMVSRHHGAGAEIETGRIPASRSRGYLTMF